jgi:hypothetical protein
MYQKCFVEALAEELGASIATMTIENGKESLVRRTIQPCCDQTVFLVRSTSYGTSATKLNHELRLLIHRHRQVFPLGTLENVLPVESSKVCAKPGVFTEAPN